MKLEQHLNRLPKHSAASGLWDKIEEQVVGDTHLAARLPVHKANPDLWLAVEQGLEKRTFRRFLHVPYIAAAASVVLVIMLSTVFFLRHYSKETIYFTEEIYTPGTSMEELKSQEFAVLENCSEFPIVCSTPDFTRLKSNLDRLKREEIKLRDLRKTTNDPKIELYHSRIVKDIRQVEAQMMQMFS